MSLKTNIISISLLLAIGLLHYCSCLQTPPENITELINEVTPEFFPEYLDTEQGSDATFLDVYDGSSAGVRMPSIFAVLMNVVISLLTNLFIFW